MIPTENVQEWSHDLSNHANAYYLPRGGFYSITLTPVYVAENTPVLSDQLIRVHH